MIKCQKNICDVRSKAKEAEGSLLDSWRIEVKL